MTVQETIEKVTAGRQEPIYYQGIPMRASRNVSGALFLTIGPIHGPDSSGRAVALVEAIRALEQD
jgi:hypothetical protein